MTEYETMRKEKIAISVDKPLLEMIDSTIDNVRVTSRSQAISILLQHALEKQYITQAVLLLRTNHIPLLFHTVDGKTVLEKQIAFLQENGIEDVYLITSNHYQLETVQSIFRKSRLDFHLILEKEQKGNVHALQLLQHELRSNFVLLNGDTLNLFSLKKMIHFHLRSDKVVTIGLTISASSKGYNTVELEGDQIVAYKKNVAGHSSVIDAGIYVCKPTLFSFFSKKTAILERDVLPALCADKHVQGYFTYGEYKHFGE
jgi:mannose-1-phosphate guanylyltransferase